MGEPVTTADLCDRFGADAKVCRAPLQSYGGRRAAWGVIECVQCLEDAALLRQLLSQPGEGRILVVDGGGSTNVAIFGENMAQLAIDRGWKGLVIHGAVRDVERLQALDLAVLALGHAPRRGGKSGGGQRGVPVRFGDVVFTPGCLVCLDGDGVVVLSRDLNAFPFAPPLIGQIE
ncbi:MAG: ribonuclease E activity regulator RraA [Proteobacteria bacterium]|nr:ribonuclease E activity regulator RraA [Pseudomonadota bacterium]